MSQRIRDANKCRVNCRRQKKNTWLISRRKCSTRKEANASRRILAAHQQSMKRVATSLPLPLAVRAARIDKILLAC